jgi:hypothetical protein
MFESASGITVCFWLAMAMLGQSEARLARSGKADPGESTQSVKTDAMRTALLSATSLAASRSTSESLSISGDENDALLDDLPAAIAAEIRSIEAMVRAIEAGGSIERWRFDRVRARYEALLKKGSGQPAVENAIQVRLARLGQLEQAAKAAATIQAILVESHRRDREVVALKRRLQTSTARHSRAYEAVGLLQLSAQQVDGQKLCVLIGKSGGTVAYLRIPPGLDPDPMLARKVGVRGVAHYDEDLQSRLITVRTLEPIEPRR